MDVNAWEHISAPLGRVLEKAAEEMTGTVFAINDRRHVRDVLISAMRLKTQFDETTDADAKRSLAIQLRDTLASAGMKTRDDILEFIGDAPILDKRQRWSEEVLGR